MKDATRRSLSRLASAPIGRFAIREAREAVPETIDTD